MYTDILCTFISNTFIERCEWRYANICIYIYIYLHIPSIYHIFCHVFPCFFGGAQSGESPASQGQEVTNVVFRDVSSDHCVRPWPGGDFFPGKISEILGKVLIYSF